MGDAPSESCDEILVKDRFNRSYVFQANVRIPENAASTITRLVEVITSVRKTIEERVVSEGSYNIIWEASGVVGRFSPERLGERFLRRVERGCRVSSQSGLQSILSFGPITREPEGTVFGFVVFMAKWDPLPASFANEVELLRLVSDISRVGFHNDLKINNLMMDSSGDLRAIDFDYFDENKLIISVSSYQSIVVDLTQFLDSLESVNVHNLRSFYDLTYLSASLDGTHPLYAKVLDRLVLLYNELERGKVLTHLISFVGESKVADLPFEVLIRCPGLEAVSYSLFDLKGNAFAHCFPHWENYPSLMKSTGVYWPDR